MGQIIKIQIGSKAEVTQYEDSIEIEMVRKDPTKLKAGDWIVRYNYILIRKIDGKTIYGLAFDQDTLEFCGERKTLINEVEVFVDKSEIESRLMREQSIFIDKDSNVFIGKPIKL